MGNRAEMAEAVTPVVLAAEVAMRHIFVELETVALGEKAATQEGAAMQDLAAMQELGEMEQE